MRSLFLFTFLLFSFNARGPEPTYSIEARAAAKTLVGVSRPIEVIATIYFPTGQPTNSGRHINAAHATQHRWIAISHCLRKQLHYGDSVHISGMSPELDGIYQVQDLMNSRFKHPRIDILHTYNTKLKNIGIWHNVKLSHIHIRNR